MSSLEDFFTSQHNLSKSTIKNYRAAINKFEFFAKAKFEDVYLDEKIVHKVLNQFSEKTPKSTWNLYLGLHKRLAKWLSDPDDEVCPKFWRRIKKKPIDWEKKLKDKWLTKEQFYKLLDVIDYPRDKAMYGVAVEGALRAGELLGLKIKDLTKTSYGYDVTVSGKTGSSSFPVVLFAPLLTQWLNHHPFKHNPNAFLWARRKKGVAKTRYGGVHNTSVHETLKKYAKLAGLPSISLHWLRHTKITWTAKDKKVRISDEMAKKMFRWSKNSRMYSHYTHLHGTDSKESFLALAGVKLDQEKEEQNTILNPKKCLNCGEMNSAEFLYCSKCGFVLSEEEARKMIEQKRLQEAFMKLAMEKLKVDKELEDLEKSNKLK